MRHWSPFGFDSADLDASAETALASILTELTKRPGAKIELDGATDSAGTYDYNVRLSRRRVEAVQRWLTQKGGVARSRITGSISRGPLADPVVKDAAKRRVLVKFMSPSEK
jgi:outer membrane protein OmpA-like peptidoglycan-associated protein